MRCAEVSPLSSCSGSLLNLVRFAHFPASFAQAAAKQLQAAGHPATRELWADASRVLGNWLASCSTAERYRRLTMGGQVGASPGAPSSAEGTDSDGFDSPFAGATDEEGHNKMMRKFLSRHIKDNQCVRWLCCVLLRRFRCSSLHKSHLPLFVAILVAQILNASHEPPAFICV